MRARHNQNGLPSTFSCVFNVFIKFNTFLDFFGSVRWIKLANSRFQFQYSFGIVSSISHN